MYYNMGAASAKRTNLLLCQNMNDKRTMQWVMGDIFSLVNAFGIHINEAY